MLRTCLGLRNRVLPLKDRSGEPLFPVFLYEESMVDGSVTKGLFHGPLLLKVSVRTTSPSQMSPDEHPQAYRTIFLGRSHASGSSGKTKSGNAKIHGMASVIPSTICYAAIQVYVALSSMEKWDTRFGDVNLSSLYDLLREQFRNPEDPWYRETLKWWNECVQ